MNLDTKQKIWRYMDFGRFISLLVNESLYFPCAMDFHDPFEGHLPISHAKAMKSITENVFGSLIQNMGTKAKGMNLPDYGSLHSHATDEVKKTTGISCWHMNDYESEAMWKLYADRGIAVESTIGQLQSSLPGDVNGNRIYVYNVRYEDFDLAEIEKGHQHYFLAIKRKSFEHEKELRASITLPVDGQGLYVKCDLNTLITKIHISPLAPEHLRADLEKLCKSLAKPLNIPVLRSALYDRPKLSGA